MSEPDREITQRELRNDVAKVLREVASGRHLRVTVRGQAVADLVPVSGKRTWVPWSVVEGIVHDAPLDAGFRADVHAALDDTIQDPYERFGA